MRRNGFTLVELMAVITVLVVLTLIIVPVIDRGVKRSKDDMYKIQIENIRMSGMGYFSDHMGSRPVSGSYCSVSLVTLINSGYISADVVDVRNGSSFTNMFVQIVNNNGRYNYLVCPNDSDCGDTSIVCS